MDKSISSSERLMRLPEVLARIPVGRSTWWGWVATGRAPRPVRLGDRCTCWRESEVLALMSPNQQAEGR